MERPSVVAEIDFADKWSFAEEQLNYGSLVDSNDFALLEDAIDHFAFAEG